MSAGTPDGSGEAEQVEQLARQAVGEVTGMAKEIEDAKGPRPVPMAELSRPGANGGVEAIDLLSDVNLQVKIELGRTRMVVEDVLRLNAGSVVELDKAAGDPVDIYVNGRHVARGEVLVLNESFCVRVSEIVDPVRREERA
ncbi:MAG: flagellar motor switch protein FliN [Phycisphaerales bacterium]|nr:flagellar motor switch protein FliN [Phycisphaerales bacterium]